MKRADVVFQYLAFRTAKLERQYLSPPLEASMTGSKNDNETLAAAPDALLTAGKDATIELSEAELSGVSGGTDKMKQLQDMTSNAAMTGQKAAEKSDQYIRS
jgi:hypothetical protein